ncbi:DUF2852 domain-containing protein [Devosia algicola]|uniref:DUF2852 domain-containing protein n=1 Tax=Devosia algicola TaxID=3026418 RepID=A0ABY7YKU8_9HYPH|nr:DUF2852 domain-containing protein [Devosia algicola]WDR01876.1 DUF2852 domain-containing protein [Devosia algicola]
MHTAIIKPQFSPITIALMVLGFIVFWPLGLAILGYIIWGEKFGGSAEKAQSYWNKGKSWCTSNSGRRHGHHHNHYASTSSGNAAFDEYRTEQLRRLEEERARLDEEINEFHDYMANLNKAKDREEFDRFMNERRGSRQGYTDDNNNGGNGGNDDNGPNNGDNNSGWGQDNR